MKRIYFLILGAGLTIGAYAQDGNNICAWNAMNTFQNGGGPSDLEAGLKCSDDASVHESTVNKSKTWFYRGQIYTLTFQDKSLKSKYPNAAFEAIKAFKKLYELNDPKFRDWEDVYKYLIPLATQTFNEGVERFQAKDYANAAKLFYSVKDINAVITGKGKTPNIELPIALKNAAIAAENAGDVAMAIEIYKDWLAIAPDAMAYRSYSQALKKQGKTDESKQVLEEAIKKYPKDATLLVDKINTYLENAQYQDALTYVNNLIEVEPKNDGAYFIKGLAYEKIGNEDSVVYYYTKTAEINPANIKPWNNLGALYVNKANTMLEDMNKLGNSSADIKKYEELKKQRKELYLKAKPYLEKAKAIEPNDPQINKTLKQIELYTTE
jgi:tetratricopeptide (TPR) repeat protein